MITLYMDVHAPEAITRALRRRGVTVITAQEDGTAEFDDPPLLDRATQLGCLLVTQDKHSLAEAAKRQEGAAHFAGIIYAPQDTALIGTYIEDLELIALAGTPEEYADRLRYLPL